MKQNLMRIAHVDLDSFFVSAERLKNPELAEKPIAVGGTQGRGVISSASYEARKFGVRSAQPVSISKRLCPELILVPPDFSLYSKLSQQVFRILGRFTPVVEPVSIDEAYLELGSVASLWGGVYQAGQEIRKQVYSETGLTITVAIASSRTVAKIATDQIKPNGLIEILPGDEARFLSSLPVSVIPGVGPATLKALHDIRVFKIQDIQETGVGMLEVAVGSMAPYLKSLAAGRGSTSFFRTAKTPSVSREHTFSKNVFTEEELLLELKELIDDLIQELKQDRSLLSGIELKLRSPSFHTWSRSRKLRSPTQNREVLWDEAVTLFREAWAPMTPIRLIGIGGPWISTNEPHQLDLLGSASDEKDRKISNVIEQVQNKLGKNVIQRG